ncbi:MAG: AAA family ATPase [Candidatus Levybacteria bacterium]|nr:AAA family ATPase [Candidatus Levybacteria bacterium]
MTQNEALDILKLGHNVYLTGPAGSGKTYLLNQYIAYLRSHQIPVGITASTGIAATHMGGVTIHSWAGMGIKDSMTESDIHELFRRSYLKSRFKKTRVLIIDEISMLHAHRLDLVHAICRAFKRIDQPFGGMQIVMCGDFFQLPPIEKNPKLEYRNSKQIQNTNDQNAKRFEHSDFKNSEIVSPSSEDLRDFEFRASNLRSNFVTESDIWRQMLLKTCYLDEQHRQDDRAFLRVLNDIRNNEVSEMTVEYLSERLNKEIKGPGGVSPTRLFTHNADVDSMNNMHLGELPGEPHEYYMSSRGKLGLTEILKKSCLAPQTLVLKKGAQVMFVKNNYEVGYVNGTLGEVIGFDEERRPVVRTFDGAEITVKEASWEVKEENTELAAISQLPLRLAWAITVHKSQGMSLDAAEIDLSRAFTPGMGYVALSRVRNLSGLKLMGMNQMALQVNPEVAAMDLEFKRQSDAGMLYIQGMSAAKKAKMQSDYLQYLRGI